MKKNYFLILFLLFAGSMSAQEKLSQEEKSRREKNIEAANPFKQFGYKAKVATLSKGKYLEVHDLDSIVTIGSVKFHVDRKEIVGNVDKDTINGIYARPIGDMPSRWLSPDPLSEEFSSWSPYSFVFNNPVRYTDPTGMAPDDVIITGAQSQAALQELQRSVQGQLTLAMDAGGRVSYTQSGTGPLTADAAQLMNAVDDHSVTVNVSATSNTTTSTGNLYIGGAFMGNTVAAGDPLLGGGNTVSANQEINPGVLSTLSTAYSKPGADTLHEVTEAYQGATLSKASGVSSGPASQAGSVYQQAHNAATPQSGSVVQEVYDANNNVVPQAANGGYPNGVRAEFIARYGTPNPVIIQTLP